MNADACDARQIISPRVDDVASSTKNDAADTGALLPGLQELALQATYTDYLSRPKLAGLLGVPTGEIEAAIVAGLPSFASWLRSA